VTSYLLPKRAALSRPSGQWDDDDFDVLADGIVVGRIFKAKASPVGSPWMWTLLFGHHDSNSDMATRRRAKVPWRRLPRAGGENEIQEKTFPLGVVMKNSISFMTRPRKAMSEWVVHCEANQRHIRHSQPTREAALKYACSQLLQGHVVNHIVGPNKTYHCGSSEGLVHKESILALAPVWLCLRVRSAV
jgi:hypothetical protein